MTVSTTVSKKVYAGNGVTTAFPTTFQFFDNTDLVVTVVLDSTGVETVKTLTTHYTVSGGDGATGTVTMLTAPASGETLVFDRLVPYTQSTDYQNNDSFPAEAHEDALDKVTILAQQASNAGLSSPVLPITFEPGVDDRPTMPMPEAGKVLVGNDAEDGWENSELGDLDVTVPTLLSGTAMGHILQYTTNGNVFKNTPAWFLTAELFGAVGDGSTDDTTALQAAVTAVGRGTVILTPGKTYKLTATVTSLLGALLDGTNRADLSVNTNGSGTTAASPRLLWAGAANGYMYVVRPNSVGDCIWGGGARGVEFDGGTLADVGMHLDNTKFAHMDVKARNVRYAGVVCDSASGSTTNFSQHNDLRSLEFVYGTAVACRPAHGLVLGGNGSTVPSTQQFVGTVSGLTYNGSLVRISETDNVQCQSIHCSVEAGGTGNALKLVFAGAQPAHNNLFVYVNGPVVMDDGLFGNTILHLNSEASGITQAAGTSQWNANIVDYGTGNRYYSPGFILRDKLVLNSSEMRGDATVPIASFGLQWVAPYLANAADQRVSCVIPSPYHWHDGVISGVEVLVGTNGTAGGNYRLHVDFSTGVTSGPAVTPERTTSQTLATGAQYVPTTYTFTFSSDLPFTKGDYLFFNLRREGTNVLDTDTDTLFILGARILYRSSGPTTGGSGTYTMPAWA